MSEEKVVAWSSQDEFNQQSQRIDGIQWRAVRVDHREAAFWRFSRERDYAQVSRRVGRENVGGAVGTADDCRGDSDADRGNIARSGLCAHSKRRDLGWRAQEAQAEIAGHGNGGKHEGSEAIGVGAEDDVRDGDYPLRQSARRQAAAREEVCCFAAAARIEFGAARVDRRAAPPGHARELS
ncbi:hypothetical protein AYI69_g2806 [Smittium culicis]|uniref:Uncharacterized protein n=1 Tax=Smittium culicis TaxID=133412 RepID=A0A1R1YLD1_9FUNG|nr:hypothetical protein AYI69_g2806 [Smittium culicis]